MDVFCLCKKAVRRRSTPRCKRSEKRPPEKHSLECYLESIVTSFDMARCMVETAGRKAEIRFTGSAAITCCLWRRYSRRARRAQLGNVFLRAAAQVKKELDKERKELNPKLTCDRDGTSQEHVAP